MFNSKDKILTLVLATIVAVLGITPLFIKTPSAISSFNGQRVEIIGIVAEPPDVRVNHTKLTVMSRTPAAGKVLVNTALYPQYRYGDELRIKCLLATPEPFEGFAYDKYLAKSGIYSTCNFGTIILLSRGNGDWLLTKIYNFKTKFEQVVNANLPEPQASFLLAISLDVRGTLPPDVLEDFNITGTTHLMAISGSHITILIVVLSQLCSALYISRKKSFWAITLIIIFYIIIIGFPASAVRAAIMGWLVIFSTQVGRVSVSTNVLLLSAVGMLAFNRQLLLYDIGFQLSFTAVLGIIYFNAFFEKVLSKVPSWLALRESLSMTLAAQVSTTPLIIFYFERYSLISPFANVLLIPTFPYLMIVSFSGLFLSLALPIFSQYFYWPTWLILEYILKTVEILSQLAYATINFN